MSVPPPSRLVPALTGVAAALLAGFVVAVGLSAGETGAWLSIAATILIIGVLTAFATFCHIRERASRRGSREQRIAERIGAFDPHPLAPVPIPADATLHEQLDVVATELRQLREIAHGVHGIEGLFDAEGRLLWISPSIARLTGWTPAECVAAPDALALIVHESDRRYCARMARRVAEGGDAEDFEMRLLRKEGGICWVACHWRPVGANAQHPDGVRMSAEDIQSRKETEYKLLETVAELRRAQALRERYLSRSNDERQRLSALLNVIRLGILFMDRDHRVQYYNRAMLDIWGFAPEENLIGVRDVVLQSRVTGLLEQPESYVEHIAAVLESSAISEPYEVRFRDGRVVTDISAVVEALQGQRGIGRVWIYEDVTEQRRIASRLVEMAERDPLTNLFNRRRFHEELNRHLADAIRRGNVQVGLIAIDLDGFKPINDEFGHQAGDEVLVKLAQGVGGLIRRNEMFFRLGGDEFGVLVADASESELCELARRILEGIEALRFTFAGREVGITASLGIALFPSHAGDAEQLIAVADQAMYRSKAGGRDRWTLAGS